VSVHNDHHTVFLTTDQRRRGSGAGAWLSACDCDQFLPQRTVFETWATTWAAASPDLVHWGDHRLLLTQRHAGWESGRIGGGAPPLWTEAGWLSIYHAADNDNRYCLGAFVTDLKDPMRLLARSESPILVPEASYEVEGFFGQVVFTCGAIADGDRLRVYYGAADESMALAEGSLSAVLASLGIR